MTVLPGSPLLDPTTPKTLAGLFWRRVSVSESRIAQRVKPGQGWEDTTWGALGQEVREVALGLLALGRQPGQSVGILAQSRAEWVRADFAILSEGGVTVTIYPTYPADGVAHILADAEVATLFVENRDQLAKALAAAPRAPALDSIVAMTGEVSSREVAVGDGERMVRLLDWSQLRARGRLERRALEPELERRIARGAADDVASIVYTSGTTGEPRGVVQTHGNHLAALAAARAVATDEIRDGDVHLLFLPLAHAFGRFEAFIGVDRGLITAFAESLERLADNLREVRPHFLCSVPRVFERVYARVLSGVQAGSASRRRLFDWAVAVGGRVGRAAQARRPIGPGLRLQHALAQRLVYRKIQAALGGRLRVCFSGGAPLSQEIAEFFDALGIRILEGYGLTETCPILTCNRPGRYRFGTVGMPYPGVELRIAEDGEILARARHIARGYHRKPAETAEVFRPDGWFHTGDIGELDADGFLRITDRKKDLIKTSGGSYVAPQQIENLLKADPLVSQALVHGDRRPYPVALLTLNPDELRRFAREAGLGDKPVTELGADAALGKRVQRTLDEVNARLPSYARVKRFAVLPGDFTQEAGELTPTLKLRRRAIAGRYQAVLDGLYEREHPA
jgi:long-chain acyl-CoA synthetase